LIHLVSDIHLQAEGPETVGLFGRYLSGQARRAKALYILGDLFEYWPGDDCLDDPDSFESRICGRLRQLAEGGTAIFFLAGNRDFLAGGRFAAASGARLLAEPHVADIEGRRALLLHGDTLCTDDLKYQAFRRTIRSDNWRTSFLDRPLADRLAEIAALRERSRQEIGEKPADIMDANGEAVAAAFREHGVDRLVHGHTHRLGHHLHVVDGSERQRWVLGDWGRSGNLLACEGDDWRFKTVK